MKFDNFHIFERTLWPWLLAKVTKIGMVLKVLLSVTIWPSFIILHLIVSEILSMFKFGTDRRTVGWTPKGQYRLIFVKLMSQKKNKNLF